MSANQPEKTIDEIFAMIPMETGAKLTEIGWERYGENVEEAKAALSAMVAEVIGEYNYVQDVYGTHTAQNDLIEEQRQRAAKMGFKL